VPQAPPLVGFSFEFFSLSQDGLSPPEFSLEVTGDGAWALVGPRCQVRGLGPICAVSGASWMGGFLV